MILRISNATISNQNNQIKLKCPHCGQDGILNIINDKLFDAILHVNGQPRYYAGQRLCPNPNCGAHIFFLSGTGKDKFLISYPIAKIDFVKDGIPKNVLVVFEEAITCHANRCYIASAIMIRRTLEEICKEKGIQEPTLFTRIQALRSTIIIPEELLNALDELRLLGNAAAHIDAETYSQVGKDEAEIAIEITKEILKALYQYEGLINRLKNLKKA